jgi:hypothetical protein
MSKRRPMAAPCSVCDQVTTLGWWGPDHRGTHCRKCHRSWTAKGAAHCPVCCEHFATDATAQLHWGGRSYEAEHLDPRSVSALVRDGDRLWHMAGKRPTYVEPLCGEALKPCRGGQVPAEVAS